MTKHDVSKYIILLATAAIFYLFCHVVPYYSDDWWHSFVHQPDGSYPTERIEDLDNLITSQINHYMNKNGRLPVTMLAQTVVTFCPKSIFDIINILFFALAVFLFAKYGCTTGNSTTAQLLTSATAIFYLLPGHYDVLMWGSGAIYYLWVTAYILYILILWRKTEVQHTPPQLYPILLILGILAGWSNESLSFGLATGVVIELFLNYKKGNKTAHYWLAAGIITGVLMIIVAPGSWKRTSWVIHRFDRPELYVTLLYSLSILGLLILSLIRLYRHNAQKAKEFITRYRICIVASVALMPVCIVTWQFAARSCYGMVLFAIIPLLSLFDKYILPCILTKKVWRRSLPTLVLLSTLLILHEHNKTEQAHRALIEKYIESSDGVVAFDVPSRSWYAIPFTLDLKKEYLVGWTAQHMSAYYNRPPLQWLSTELYDMFNHPQLLFTEENRVTGSNQLYTTPTLDVYVVKPGSQCPEMLNYTYTKVSFGDDVPFHAKLLRHMRPERYPISETKPAYTTTYTSQDFGTYRCIIKNRHRNVVQIDYPCNQ